MSDLRRDGYVRITHRSSKDNNSYYVYMYNVWIQETKLSFYGVFKDFKRLEQKENKMIVLETEEASLNPVFSGAVFQ